ncbi:MAG: tyrosine-protein phosphatase [Alphaproteobacteria bacterium]
MNRPLPPPAGAPPLSAPARLAARVVGRLFNWHWIEPGLARAAQTYGWQTPLLLRHHAIRCLVNLRGDNTGSPWYDNERRSAEGLGVTYVDVSLSSKRLPAREHLLQALDAVVQAPRPTLIKCSGGADRTGFVAGLYLLDRHGLGAMAQARRQLAYWPYLHIPKPRQRWIRAFLDFIVADTNGKPLRDWLASDYTAERFEAFLVARGQHRYWKRN